MVAELPKRQTVRDKIMCHLVERFENDTNELRPVWGVVTRRPLTKAMTQDHDYALGLYDTSEVIREAAAVEYRNLNVVIEFHVHIAEGDDPSSFLNHCLGSISDRIGEDIHLGGLALNCRENGSELDIDGPFDHYVSGIIVFDVQYRTRSNDPYTQC